MKKRAQFGIRNSFIGLLFFSGCLFSCRQQATQKDQKIVTDDPRLFSDVPDFNADSAYQFTEQQTQFGPRVPNTNAHVNCGDLIIATMRSFADTVYVQSAKVKAFDRKELSIRNIIASWKPDLKNRILLCAHWDSRPFADNDSLKKDQPILGANDGAASCGVLMEIGRLLKQQKPSTGVDIIFFDAEDYGQPINSPFPRMEDSYCLGSQYWCLNMHIPGYYASYGILLDMIGSENATFAKEGTSMQYAASVVNKVWTHAGRIGYSDYFLFRESSAIIDDHYYINRITHIPVIDIVHHDPATLSNFWKYWHTHHDTMDKISKKSLKAVGQTILETIFKEGTIG